MNYREVTCKLKRLGCQELLRRGSGSHRTWYNPSAEKFTSIPDLGSRDLKFGTIRAVIKQLGINWNDFEKS
jgi:predicted RNA binding protein YcfA (HicA-like mRNA interferase family)